MSIRKVCGALILSTLLLVGPHTGRAGADPIPGDFDDDGDIDLTDFAHFQACALGAAIAQTAPECADARLDADSDVDLDDFAILQGCLSGAGNPADPNCSCPSGQTSCDGTCASDGERFLLCDGICRDVWVDVGNCGGCGIVCGSGQTCVGAQCQDQEPCWDCGGARFAGPLAEQVGTIPVQSDFDHDGDVDLTDFAHFQTCALGAAIAQTDPECTDARLDADQDVDLDDFAVFQGCISGSDIPADPECACMSGETNCAGTCTNTQTDSANCGACGNVVDVLWDSRHCGGCGIVCPEHTACAWGTCEGICIGCG